MIVKLIVAQHPGFICGISNGLQVEIVKGIPE